MRAVARKSILFLMLLCIKGSITLKAQAFTTDTILYNGNSSKFINLVFMSDGFQAAEISTYLTNVRDVSNYLFSISPFSEYKNYFNIFAIRVPSVQSGANHPGTASDEGTSGGQPVVTVTNYFNSTFDFFSIHRLLVPQNATGLNNVLMVNFPLYDQPLMLVNSSYYGGSGGFPATSSLNTSSFEVLVHEIGHSLAGLADEYYAGDFYAAENLNMTQQTNPALVKWKNWIGTDGIGIYQHCCGGNAALWYKPHMTCKMQYLGYPFCAVCKEAFVETFHRLIGTPVLSFVPSNQSTVSTCFGPQKFSISLLKPGPNTLRVRWLLNGASIAVNTDSVEITAAQLSNGNNSLSAEVTDTTALSRSDAHPGLHTYTTSWTVSANGSGSLLAADTSIIVVCADDKTSITGLYNTSGLTTQWDIPDPSVADTGIHRLTVTSNSGCMDTAFVTVKQQVVTWAGTISSDWNNPQNWTPQLVPSEKTHVIINSATPFPCVISNGPAVAASVQVKPGANYNIINNQQLAITAGCSSLPVQ